MKSKKRDAGNDLSTTEQKEAEERSAISAAVIHEAIRKEGLSELERPSTALMWSGLASGSSMGFSLIAQGLLSKHLAGVSWAPLISSFGYAVGFLIVILGRQQLFTENTLTAVIPLLHEHTFKRFLSVLRLWGIVLGSNLAGAFIVAWVLANTTAFQPDTKRMFLELGTAAIQPGFTSVLLSGIFAGWLIATMVWMLPAAQSAKVWVIVIITYIVGLGGMSHIIAGSVETLYLVASGSIPFTKYVVDFMLPSLIGNTVGGVTIVAAINHAQVVAGSREKSTGTLKQP